MLDVCPWLLVGGVAIFCPSTVFVFYSCLVFNGARLLEHAAHARETRMHAVRPARHILYGQRLVQLATATDSGVLLALDGSGKRRTTWESCASRLTSVCGAIGNSCNLQDIPAKTGPREKGEKLSTMILCNGGSHRFPHSGHGFWDASHTVFTKAWENAGVLWKPSGNQPESIVICRESCGNRPPRKRIS